LRNKLFHFLLQQQRTKICLDMKLETLNFCKKIALCVLESGKHNKASI
jgi:hypothetical protein